MGNWGHASEHIGKRWEALGAQRLDNLLSDHRPWPVSGWQPVGSVSLAANDAMQSTLSRVGLPSPDVIVGLVGLSGQHGLQAVDMKWHIEFASYKQISASALRELLSREIPGLNEQVLEQIGPLTEEMRYLDGLLLAPDTQDNRYFLSSTRNRRQEYPIEPRDVIFESVDGREFFGQLPGWQMGLLLADFDRARRALDWVEGAERYYRLGAGLQGAAGQLLTSVFAEAPVPISADKAYAWLRGLFDVASTSALAREVDRLMAHRSQLLTRLRELMRSPYRLGDLAQTLRKRGLSMPRDIEEETPLAARCRELLKQVSLFHRAAVRGEGLRLVEGGATDGEAIAALGHQTRRFRTQAQAEADRLAGVLFSH